MGDDQEDEAEDIYWSSRENSGRFSNSLYDSYDPFSYMADRVSSIVYHIKSGVCGG